MLRLSDANELHVYSLTNLMAEKYRSLLQQPLQRRNRYQDVYDLYFLINKVPPVSIHEQAHLLEYIQVTCKSKSIIAKRDSLNNPTVQSMAGDGYKTLTNDLSENLPEFDLAYSTVLGFYENLPWQEPEN
ncbi:nucleotidyl transferase AbiEii/AbiGii toxin family protein [Limnobacter sp.]|uniref:nucleotidyl transferase AbiEii/AbiGii toxin family protein n=1 Tax=Limnobacter sp. TaxID=2003368 RepID=UPI002FE3BAAA